MLALLIIAALLVVLSPFAAIPLLRRAETHAQDNACDGPARAVFTQETH
jgi:hypothetical protein